MSSSQSFPLPAGFIPSLLAPPQLLLQYFSVVFLVLLPAWYLTGHVRGLGKGERRLACSMLGLALNHSVVEAYYFFTPHFYQTSSAMLLPEIWKLCGLADLRYFDRDSTIMGVEGVSVFILGPMALLSIYGIAAKKWWLHPMVLVYCSAKAMMALSFYLSTWSDKSFHSLDSFHFWFYHVFFGTLYGLLIPSVIGVTSLVKIDHIIYSHTQKVLQKPMKSLN